MIPRRWILPASLLFATFAHAPAQAQVQAQRGSDVPLPVRRFQIIARESGPVDYYGVVDDPSKPFIRGEYRPGLETAVVGVQLTDDERARARHLRWSWRALTLPQGGNACDARVEDSAATVYVTWRRGMRWYVIKYVWSAVGPKGTTCARKRNPFVAQDTVIVESGGPLNAWRTVSLDLDAEFRNHFEDGDATATVPAMLGIGLMTDGDQTKSNSVADYAAFALSP